MKKLNESEIKSIAKDLMFELNDEELKAFSKNSTNFFFNLELVKSINTEGVDPMSYPLDNVFGTLREDTVNHTLDIADALKNAPKTEDDYVEVVQVIDK
ncbi:MAG TPA: Asp-tRNA(Asn)/Glu-tRNA(Gln) amidotransferase subunit GatC [Erysipelothrix sp.]|nr:Asp-tRNA(Asn)/Glu-tRNA(Gln) amidotransferase subunit GatC [Erysipelothrix sp.]